MLQQLACALGEEDGDSIENWIAARASSADDTVRFEAKSLMTDRADEAAELFGRQGALGHDLMLRLLTE